MAFNDKSKQIAYQNGFNLERYDRIQIMLPKGYKERLREVSGGNITGYIKRLVDAALNEKSTEE